MARKTLPYIADIHTHPTMKPYRQIPEASIWEAIPESNLCQGENLPRLARSLDATAKASQTNLDKARTGNVRMLITSFYIPERKMFQLRKITDILSKDEREINLGACISGFARDKIAQYFNEHKENLPVNYFAELHDEYLYLAGQQAKEGENGLCIVGDYKEMRSWLAKSRDNIATLISLEGLHSLCHFARYQDLEIPFREVDDEGSMEYQHFLGIYDQNIKNIKQWGDGRHAPFYVTAAHFFWNMICGHARTAGGTARTFGINQNFQINDGITLLGKEVFRRLYSRENGRRILIDIKHMSPDTRIEFYNMWEQEYRQKGDVIPIICSHAAVNGIESLSDKRNNKDNNHELKDSYFNTWSINLTDEDILRIQQSGGLIGIIMQTDRIAGGLPKDIIDNEELTDDQRRDEYVRMFMSNVFHIIKVCNDKSAWDRICLGTDYDGLVNPFRYYSNYSEFGLMADHFFQFFERPIGNEAIGISAEEMEWFKFGYSAQELVEKVMYRNVEQFLERYFNDEYLQGTKPEGGELIA